MKRKNGGGERRATRGQGHLFKRDATGGKKPASWTGPGHFYLSYSIPTASGEPTRHTIALRDEHGDTITDRTTAEKARQRILAPFTTGDAAEAERQVLARVQAAERAVLQAVDDANPPLTIAGAWEAFLASPERPDSGPATLCQYEGHWQRFRRWIADKAADGIYLRDVSPTLAADYAADLSRAKLSGNRINKHTTFLKMLFRVLTEPGRLTCNPFEKIRRKNQTPHSRRELTADELVLVLDSASGDLALLLLIGAATGLRLGDCATLQWGEVDLARGIIRRIPNKTAKSGKPVVLGIPPRLHDALSAIPPKRRKGFVLPYVAATYQSDVAKLTDTIKAHFLDCGIDVHTPGTGKRIVRDQDGEPIRNGGGKVVLSDTGKPAVVEVGFHSLRHTWVSLHAQAGTPGAVIQASVGHANPAMTAHYTHVNEATARDVARALPAFAGNGDGHPTREPLPGWARDLIESLSTKNVKAVKTALLKG